MYFICYICTLNRILSCLIPLWYLITMQSKGIYSFEANSEKNFFFCLLLINNYSHECKRKYLLIS